MAALTILMTAGAIASGNLELRDDGGNGRQIGLKLNDAAAIVQRGVTVGALKERHIHDTVRRGGGTQGRDMATLSAGLFAAFLQGAAAKAIGLAVLLAGSGIQLRA